MSNCPRIENTETIFPVSGAVAASVAVIEVPTACDAVTVCTSVVAEAPGAADMDLFGILLRKAEAAAA